MTEQERIGAAEHLCATIAACHPDDARTLLTGILQKFSAEMPVATFGDDCALEAESQAAFSQVGELQAYGQAIIRQLGASPDGKSALKRLLVQIWEHLPQSDHSRFLDHLDDCSRFTRKDAA